MCLPPANPLRTLPFTVALLLIVIGSAVAQTPTNKPVTDQQVAEAIQQMVQFLYSRQNQADGTWERKLDPDASNFGGHTALAVNALLLAGETPQNPPLTQAIRFLSTAKLRGTYEVAVRAHVWALLPKEYLRLLQQDTKWLLNAHDGRSRFRYSPKPRSFDHSATQYALLGLWEAAKRGRTVSTKFWLNAQKHFVENQNFDGGWGYMSAEPSKGSMTAAGLTVLLVTQQQLYSQRDRSPLKVRDAIRNAQHWLDRHFNGPYNRMASGLMASHHYYYLYSIERAALASGFKFLGDQDWFATGAQHILDQLKNNASEDDYGSIDGNVVNTSFALMFLVRGRTQTWITKLKLPDQPWNHRPNDINHLTAYLSDLRESELNWQLVNLDMPAMTMINAPVAYLSSDTQLVFTATQLQNLKDYLDFGGLLLACPQKQSPEFRQSIRKVANELYPQWPMTPVPHNHPIYGAHYPILNKQEHRIDRVTNGARDLIFLTHNDWGKNFQNNHSRDKGPPWKLATNLFAIATDRGQLSGRLVMPFEQRINRPDTKQCQITLTATSGQDIIEPRAWWAMGHHLFNRTGINLQIVRSKLPEIGTCQTPLVHLGGVEPVVLQPTELAAISQYVRRGGTLLIETIGGQGQFASHIEAQLDGELGSLATQLTSSSPLINGKMLAEVGGADMSHVTYRRYAAITESLGTRSRLSAYFLDRRPCVIVSHLDLSMGMLGLRQSRVKGYAPKSARGLVANIILKSCRQPLKPTLP
ncbi:MAG: hypothetical protein CMJ20_03940 [Phycisphaeraceae bacterium]|nr:hypothetical protein [Phycisphaeraceae bacterium]